MERIPLGMYTFSYENSNSENQGIDYTCEVMVYNSTEKSYQDFINYLPELFKKYNCTDTDTLPDEILFKMEAECHDKFFKYETIPPYAEEDVLNILKYYDQFAAAPPFYSFDYINKKKLDITQIAKHIINEDMGSKKEKDYIDSLWNNNDENLLRLFFNDKIFFVNQLTLEKNKIVDDKIILDSLFKPATLEEIEDNQVIITTELKWNIDAILEKRAEIESILSNSFSKPIKIKVLEVEEYKKSKQKKVPKIDSHLHPDMTFANFIVGNSNRMAQNAALLVSTKPGMNFNPLFLYSHPGLGKTHLLNAIGNKAKETNPNLLVRYITSKDFVDEIINSIKTNTTDEIYSYYRNLDILLIDDIQFLFGKEKSSEMFFHIFNEIINNNHQIVITSDKMPDELQGIEERLISRFKSGLSFGIDPPEFETAKAILEKKIENLGNTDLVITDDVLDFMVMNYCNDIRSLEGQLKRLFFCSIMESTNYIDMNFASEVFKDQKTIKKAQEPLTKEFILKTTAEFYYLTISQIISKNRTRNLVTPREICMYLMRELLDITFSEIGTTFSNRDHSTVMKACKRVETKIKKDPDYKLAVDKLKQKLGTM